MENFAYDYDLEEEETKYELINGKMCGLPPYEIIGGEKIMSPAPTSTHGALVVEMILIFGFYINSKKIKAQVFGDNVDVHFSAVERYKPDVSVVCNLDIIDWKGAIKGAPDLIVEVFSNATKKRDMGIKKDTYEKYGVREYWLVDPKEKSIVVYHLINNKYEFAGEFATNGINTKIKVSIFDDLIVDVRDVFKWWLD